MAIKSFYGTGYGLSGNPFPQSGIYGPDKEMVYVPEVFGPTHDQFLRKFILAPLENGQPLTGALWSVAKGDPRARGFGKSTLMGEEAKRINSDFGRSTLVALGVPEEDASDNPIMAGYVTFDAKSYGGITNIDSAAFHLMRFMVRCTGADGQSIHKRLRTRAIAALSKDWDIEEDGEEATIIAAVRERFHNLSLTIDIRNKLEEFLGALASEDEDVLDDVVNNVGTWHHDRNGLKYLQIFTVFAELANVSHMTFFVDQVEDFTTEANPKKIRKNVKIIRDALIEAEPFASNASFVFQLHPQAYSKLRDAWEHEDLPSLEMGKRLNEDSIVVLKGLETFESAKLLANRMMNDPSIALPIRKGKGITPFTDEAMKKVWEATRPIPRHFLEALHRLLRQGMTNRKDEIDLDFVAKRLEIDDNEVESDETNATDDRLA